MINNSDITDEISKEADSVEVAALGTRNFYRDTAPRLKYPQHQMERGDEISKTLFSAAERLRWLADQKMTREEITSAICMWQGFKGGVGK